MAKFKNAESSNFNDTLAYSYHLTRVNSVGLCDSDTAPTPTGIAEAVGCM